MEEQQYKSSFVRALAERWQLWRPMAVDKVGKMDRVPRMIIRSALDTFDIFNRMPEFLEKLDGDDKVRVMIEAEIKALAAAIGEAPAPVIAGEAELPATEETEEAENIEEADRDAAKQGLKDIFDSRVKPLNQVGEEPKEPEPQYVQKFDDETQRWQIINKETGEVINRKKSPEPYKSVPMIFEVKDAGDGEVAEQANTADQAEAEQ